MPWAVTVLARNSGRDESRIGGPVATKEVTVQVKISARHGHLSAEHQAEIQEKAEKLLHYFERLMFIEVTVDLQHEAKIVEVIALAEHKQEFIGVDTGTDLLVTLGHAIDKVKHQINHYKERIQDHRRNPSHGGPEGIHP